LVQTGTEVLGSAFRCKYVESPPAIFQRRPVLDLVAFAVVLLPILGLSCFANLCGLTFLRAVADPMRIEIYGLSATDTDSVAVSAQLRDHDPDTGEPIEQNGFRTSDAFRWDLHWLWVKAVHLHFADGSLERVKGASVTIGETTTTYTGEQVRNWPRVPVMSWALLNAGHPDASLSVPFPADRTQNLMSAVNWPSNATLFRAIVVPAIWFFVLFTIFLLAFWYAMRSAAFQGFLTHTLGGEYFHAMAGSRLWAAFGLLIVIAGIVIFEAMRPYAFTQDDNFNQFMPVVIRSGETLLAGHMPMWNPYQLLGIGAIPFPQRFPDHRDFHNTAPDCRLFRDLLGPAAHGRKTRVKRDWRIFVHFVWMVSGSRSFTGNVCAARAVSAASVRRRKSPLP